MTEDLLHVIQENLRQRWEGKLPHILERARNFASASMGRLKAHGERADIEKALREAYSAGYREGYWEGVVDVVECGARHERAAPAPSNPMYWHH